MNLDMTKLSKSGTGSATLNIKGEYIPIPIGVVVDKIIFNLDLSVSEVQNILSNLVLPSDMPAYMIFSNTTNVIHLMVINYGAMMGISQKIFVVMGQLGNDEIPVWSDPLLVNESGFSGWNTEAFTQLGGNELTIGVANDSTYVTDGVILQVGAQNDVISQIFNIGAASIEKELKGDYDSVSVKATSNGDIDFLPYIDNQQIPTKVKVEVPEPKLQSKTVTPTTSKQTITNDEGYDGLSQVVVNAVNSSIDNNIKPENIKRNVNILGVTGEYETRYDMDDTPSTGLVTEIPPAMFFDYYVYEGYTGNSPRYNTIQYKNVTRIGDSAFNGCNFYHGVFNNCEAIGAYGIMNTPVKTLSIPKVKTLGYCALADNQYLQILDFHQLTHMNASAFSGCSSLNTLIIRTTSKVCTMAINSVDPSPFERTPLGDGTGILYVPDELVASYKADANWQTVLPNYNTQIKPLSEYVEE